MAMSFLRRTYPNQLSNYSGDYLPDALDIITAGLTTPAPSDRLRLNGRLRHHPWKELDVETFCGRQLKVKVAHDADSQRSGLAEFWRKRRKTGRRRRRRPGSRSSAGGAVVGRSARDKMNNDDATRTLERGNSSTFVVAGAPDTADVGHSGITEASVDTSSPADSATADTREEMLAVNNATDGDKLRFKTAHLLHYASIVILGLFVLQVIYITIHQFLFHFKKRLCIQFPTNRCTTNIP